MNESDNKNNELFPELPESGPLSSKIDRRTFIIRNAVIGAAAVMTGTTWTREARAQQAAKEAAKKPSLPPLDSTSMSTDLDVVKRSKGPVMTVLDEFYKVGPGPSSSHTIGPMRITYDFYQRCMKLPADQLTKATGLKVHLYGSLSATGKGHGTERAALAGLLGKEPATVDPLFLDEMKEKSDRSYPLKLGDKTFNLSLTDIIYDSPNGEFPHPNTMTCKLMSGDKAIYELEYYSPGGGFYEWKGYTPPKKGQPKYPYATMKELRQHAEKNNLSIAQVIMANEVAVSGKTEDQINAFLDKIAAAMIATVKAGLAVKEGVLPGPIKLHSKAATVWERAQDDKYEADKAVAMLSACALAASEENARGHLVITAPTGGSAGVMPAIVYALTQTKRVLPQDKIRQGLLGGAAVGYLCKHNATLSGAEGGCQSEIGVASAMSAAFIASALDASPLVTENAAESALEHHLGMTCDPVAGYVQVPCIERCAFGSVKAWTAYMIATNEIASRHRVDLDTTIETLAETGKDMSTKYKETSEAGLAANLVLC
ncbi:MAG TPA: L-serine ammonia-lyase [Chthoniobacterales bacterium]|jgi:L-serine dehydratase|nr:L-serine ammonia-lyase [Chthoniobacterales bacterium]